MRILKAGGSGRRKMVVRVVTPGRALHTADFLITLSVYPVVSFVLAGLHQVSYTALVTPAFSPSGLA